MNNDLISRSYLKQMIPAPIEDEYKYVHQIIDNAPTAEPLYTITSNTFVEGASMRPHGEWKVNNYGEHICPICGHYALYDECQDNDYYEAQSNFCPECGADLRGGSK